MKAFRVRHPSPALVVSVIALVAALGGTSYAAFSLPKNSVGEKQLRNAAVTNPKLKNGAVGPAKIKDGAVTTAKIANGAVTGAKVNLTTLGTVLSANHASSADTATNAGHASSADSATNAASANALTGVNIVRGDQISNPAGSQDYGETACPAGQYPIGGGVWGSDHLDQSVNSSWPTRVNGSDPQPDAWGAYVNNNGTTAQTFYVYAICASGSVASNYSTTH